MNQLEQLRVNAMREAEEAAHAIDPIDALRSFIGGRGRIFLEANRLGLTDGVRDQLMIEYLQRFALKSGIVTFWAMRKVPRDS